MRSFFQSKFCYMHKYFLIFFYLDKMQLIFTQPATICIFVHANYFIFNHSDVHIYDSFD